MADDGVSYDIKREWVEASWEVIKDSFTSRERVDNTYRIAALLGKRFEMNREIAGELSAYIEALLCEAMKGERQVH
jgi:hypothetical protein